MSNYDIQIRGRTEVKVGETATYLTSYPPGIAEALYVLKPDGVQSNISSTLFSAGTNFIEKMFTYTFVQSGEYFFKFIDTGVSPVLRGVLSVFVSVVEVIIPDVKIMVPPMAKLGESWNPKIVYDYDPANNVMALYALDPIGAIYDISTNLFRYNPSSAVDIYDFKFTFARAGMYTFYVKIQDVSTAVVKGEGWVSVYVAEWANNLDIPVSQILKQKTEIERLRTVLNRPKKES